MKLIGELKKQVEETKNKEEAKKVIEKAGIALNDEEMDNIDGGWIKIVSTCSLCGSQTINGLCSNKNCKRSFQQIETSKPKWV